MRRRVSEVSGRRVKRSSGIVEVGRRRRRELGHALVAFGEEAKCINLMDEVGHTSPSTKAKPDNQDPYYYEYVDRICPHPSSHVFRRLLHRILPFNTTTTIRLFSHILFIRKKTI